MFNQSGKMPECLTFQDGGSSSHENKICMYLPLLHVLKQELPSRSTPKQRNSGYAPGQVHVKVPCPGEEPEFHLL